MVYNSFGDSSERESESPDAQNNESNTTLAIYSTFTNSQKRLIVFLTAFTSLFSPSSSTIYYPALTFIAQDLNVSLEMMNLTITSYLVISSIAPALLGEMADTLGRRPIYIGMMMVYVAANIALASQHSILLW
jgi:MFS family permease